MKKYVLLCCGLCCCLTVLGQKRSITVDSAQIWINTIGLEDRKAGQAVIVFESGLGTPMDNWDRILEEVSKMGPVITYDRPGVGKSPAINEMPTIKNVSDRLVRIFLHLEVEPPFVLVGHSLGGVYVRGFANYYPELLAGLVIIDPADFTETSENQRAYYKHLNWETTQVDSLIQSFIDKRKNGRVNAPPAIQREGEVLEALRESSFRGVAEIPLPNIPVHILTGGRFDLPKKYWSKAYDEEALFRAKMNHRLLRWTAVIQSVEKGMIFYSGDAGHFVHIDDPELVISSIRIVLLDFAQLRNAEDP